MVDLKPIPVVLVGRSLDFEEMLTLGWTKWHCGILGVVGGYIHA